MALTSSKHEANPTPLADRLSRRERRNWRRRLARAELSGEIKDVIGRTTDRTRLWKSEKAAVADELIAHFADGLDAGVSSEKLISEFGDERVAAQLIRRAKRRNRPLAWHAWKYTFRGLLVLAGLYAIVMARYLTAKPTLSVNYLAKLNAKALSTPEAERGWPLFRDAMTAMGQFGARRDGTLDRLIAADGRQPVVDATPRDMEAWPILTAWLAAHQTGLAQLRQAAARPEFGFVLGPRGSLLDFTAPEDFGHWRSSGDDSLIGVILPHLQYVRSAVSMLAADARYAATQNDGDRVTANIEAIFDLAATKTNVLLHSQHVAVGMNGMAFEQIEWVLANRAEVLSDAQLIALAHRAGGIGGETASSLFDLSGERMAFYDAMQRVYSDDGHGDGHLTAAGLRRSPVKVFSTTRDPVDAILENAGAGALSALSSRRDVIAEYDRLLALAERALAMPIRDWAADDSPMAQYERRQFEIAESLPLQGRYLPIKILAPGFATIGAMAERTLGQRDGVCVGLALELHRRRHGDYPNTLVELTPTLLPRVPTDRINGQPVRYRLIDGQPVVYSVGADQDDDHARPASFQREPRPNRTAAAYWRFGHRNDVVLDGDWLLFDARADH